MRTLGVAILGIFAGLAGAFLLTDILARLVMGDGGPPPAWAAITAFVPVLFMVAGAVIAIKVDQRRRRGPERS